MKTNSFYIILIAFVAAIGGFLLGFDGSVISGAAPFYKSVFGLQDGSFLFGFSVSCIIWGSIFGNLFAGSLSARIGRKRALIISAILFLVSSLATALASSVDVFIGGRIMAGVAVGFAILIAPVYIAEIAPPEKRGWLVSFNQLLIVIGLSAAYFSNYIILKLIGDPLVNWRWMLGVEAFPSLLYLVLLFFIPESPRWLMIKGRKEQAFNVLRKIRGPQYAQQEFEQIETSIAQTANVAESLLQQAKAFFSPRMRLILIIGVGLAVFQQFSGINAILYYAPIIFESAGGGRDAAFMQAVVLGIVFLVMTIASMFLIDRIGRKPLLYIGVSLMAVSLLVTGFAFQHAVPSGEQLASITNDALQANSLHVNTTVVLISILGFITGFSISLGPVMWAMFSEIFPTGIKAFAISAVGVCNSMASFVVATLFPVQLAVLGNSNTYFMYAAFMLLCLWFVWKYVKETKGKSLEAIENELIKT